MSSASIKIFDVAALRGGTYQENCSKYWFQIIEQGFPGLT
jgi:hypothetical protein